MTGTTRSAFHRKTALGVWISLVLMLFNVTNGADMAVRSLTAAMTGDAPICSVHHDAAGHHPQTPAHPSDCCSCCPSLCCTGATLPDCNSFAVAPPSAWTTPVFTAASAAPYNQAPRTGGSARAPPAIV